MTAKTLEFTRENFDLVVAKNSQYFDQILSLKESKVLWKNEKTFLEKSTEDWKNKYNYLLEQIRLMKQRQFAKKTEQSEGLFQQELGFGDGEIKEETKEPVATETITYTRQKKQTGRNIDTSELPREQIIHDLSAEDKICQCCGKELEKIGEDKSEQLEYIPEQLKVIEHIRIKYTCRCCETIKTAEKPESPLPKSMAGASLISNVIIKKYNYHLPWHRQSQIFAQSGLDIPANTLSNWFMEAGAVLEPLQAALWSQLNQTNVLQADETTVKVLKEDIKGYIWVYHSCVPANRFVVFEYNDSRSGKVASDSLKDYQGILQSDGYSGYNCLRGRAGITHIGCWAHARRKFVEVVKLTNKTGTAHEIEGLIGKLYKIEEKARENQLNYEDRHQLRQTEAKSIIEKIKKCLMKANPPPQSAIGKAITYTLNQWEYLERYLDYGAAEIDNNWVENQIRPFVLGRKNWLFVGNKKAADIAAFFYSIIQTCKLNNIDMQKYLTYVLNQAHKMRRREIDPKILLPQFINRNLLL